MVKAAIRTLAEVEHRALTPAPYWKLPGANKVVPRLVEFNTDMDLLNSVLYRLIDECLESRNPEELEDLKKKDYSKVKDPSMLRFLVDLRGEEVDNTQARDPTHLTHSSLPTHPTPRVIAHPHLLSTTRRCATTSSRC